MLQTIKRAIVSWLLDELTELIVFLARRETQDEFHRRATGFYAKHAEQLDAYADAKEETGPAPEVKDVINRRKDTHGL